MYAFEDYFDLELKDVPYRSGEEELNDWLRLLDMVLEGYLEFKKAGTKGKLFSRGLVITESEMESYFSMPPKFRERDLCDPQLAEAAAKALEYIENRANRTLMLGGTNEQWVEAANAAAQETTHEADMDFGAEETNAELSAEETNAEAASEEANAETASEEANAESGPEESADIDVLWIHSLRQIYDLDFSGVMAVVLALASVTDRRYERIFGFLQDDISRIHPTVGLLNALMARITPREAYGELPAGMLDSDIMTSLFISSEERYGLDTELIINPLLKRIVLGLPDDETLLPEALSIYHEENSIPLFFEDSGEELWMAMTDPGYKLCYVECEDADTVLHIMYCYARVLGMPLYVLDLRRLLGMSNEERSECMAELSLRIQLGNGLLCVRYSTEKDGIPGEEREMAVRRWRQLERITRLYGDGCVVLFGENTEPGELIVKSVPHRRIASPDVRMRTAIWQYFLTEEKGTYLAKDVVIEDLADCYDISYGMIRNTVKHAKAASGTRGSIGIDREVLLDSIRQLNLVDFSGLASYVKASYTWEDISIGDEQREVLRIACDRYRLRNRVGQEWGLTKKNAYGNGVSLLLFGPPGTGKTMAAQVVSNELGIPLYRVDISRIFSKYIGETEKNLSVIFNAARGSNVILFFDEADALFAKRTEISGSTDKYSNSETAYLLQKIEEYDGMSILATNLYSNFDTAFVRRITYAVRLDNPDEEARYKLWTTILPRDTEKDENIPYKFFANKFELSGANIKAILFNAAYMAGAEGKPVGVAHIVKSMEYEYRKLGRFINRDDFGPFAQYLSMSGRGYRM